MFWNSRGKAYEPDVSSWYPCAHMKEGGSGPWEVYRGWRVQGQWKHELLTGRLLNDTSLAGYLYFLNETSTEFRGTTKYKKLRKEDTKTSMDYLQALEAAFRVEKQSHLAQQLLQEALQSDDESAEAQQVEDQHDNTPPVNSADPLVLLQDQALSAQRLASPEVERYSRRQGKLPAHGTSGQVVDAQDFAYANQDIIDLNPDGITVTTATEYARMLGRSGAATAVPVGTKKISDVSLFDYGTILQPLHKNYKGNRMQFVVSLGRNPKSDKFQYICCHKDNNPKLGSQTVIQFGLLFYHLQIPAGNEAERRPSRLVKEPAFPMRWIPDPGVPAAQLYPDPLWYNLDVEHSIRNGSRHMDKFRRVGQLSDAEAARLRVVREHGWWKDERRSKR